MDGGGVHLQELERARVIDEGLDDGLLEPAQEWSFPYLCSKGVAGLPVPHMVAVSAALGIVTLLVTGVARRARSCLPRGKGVLVVASLCGDGL